ncbi:ABC-type proline glycine betaine transporter [Amylolactobacillus amylotrophicus DSM 20534]|uniref:ABC-type proline glycine betaine transporter n=3 Tax=Amylolactobacillus TaxID=2767876 RepID=A0A0R1YIY2_9LACO|nr:MULTISPECIES: ABC transporter permease/substrate-binding protein [Amylolactobacillus]APT18272.1 glycine/betaine ABC transporter permease [Amylolactobacillus amylophilus DSM 20533 = JCM 1125]KRK38051.1 ABC-type proline glycine betaine transporter [Amylolactobacillus amylotrophicus DSM 20534]KRM42311.1 ABC-type proline glycine betaine transporter [Amylolactobacillus amylophilus DSM 20533 = JCM 1125]GED80136.1 glycine/betaine ABC transporter permease [Amylolactobacillus amylophilus]
MNIIQTLVERKAALLTALLEHLNISVLALLVAIAIAIPLAIWAKKHQRFAEILVQLAGILQTIPSLALLGLLIPLVGIGQVPAVIALVIYAILPIFQNTYLGLTEINPSIEEAAVAFGMSFRRRLIKVELPIAMPVIISGIRTAFVMIVGTATLAALIGAGGLGSFILLGIDRNNTALILIGAISSALLAVLISGLINLLQKLRPVYAIVVLGVVLVGYVGQAVYQNVAANQTEKVVIAGKLGSEPDILINMYKELIEDADPHINVELKQNFGKTSFVYEALKANQVDIYPEFTGTVLESLVKKTPAVDQVKTPAETYQLAKKLLASQSKMTLLPPMKYQNTYAIAVKKSFATNQNLKTIGDLAKIGGNQTAGFTLEFTDRPDGYPAIKQAYGLNFTVKTMEPKLRYAAIKNDSVQVVDAYSTDSELVQYNLSLLTDDQNVFPSYQGAPLMKTSFAKKHPKVVAALNKLRGKITEHQMQEMNYAVNVHNEKPKAVAHKFLQTHGLVGDK